MKTILKILLVGFIIGSIGGVAHALPFEDPVEIRSPDPTSPYAQFGERFGNSMATIGDNIVVGSYTWSYDTYLYIGIAYVILGDPDTPYVIEALQNPYPYPGDQFGLVIKATEDVIAVSTANIELTYFYTGRVYLFDVDGNHLQTLVKPTPPIPWDYFAWEVAVLGDKIIVSAYGDAGDTGKVYVYDGDPSSGTFGDLLFDISSPYPAAGAQFGYALAAVGDDILVGEPGAMDGGSQAGIAYLFDGATGNHIQTFHSPTLTDGGGFGSTVAALGDDALIRTRYEVMKGVKKNAGVVYRFNSDGDLLATFTSPTPASGDYFGWRMVPSGTNILIAEIDSDVGEDGSGSVHLFDSDGHFILTLTNPLPVAGEYFGYSLASLGDNVFVGAPLNDGTEPDSEVGVVYAFEAMPTPGTAEEAIEACIAEIDALPKFGQQKGLLKLMENALRFLNDGDNPATCESLAAGIELAKEASGKKLTPLEAGRIISCAQLASYLIPECQ